MDTLAQSLNQMAFWPDPSWLTFSDALSLGQVAEMSTWVFPAPVATPLVLAFDAPEELDSKHGTEKESKALEIRHPTTGAVISRTGELQSETAPGLRASDLQKTFEIRNPKTGKVILPTEEPEVKQLDGRAHSLRADSGIQKALEIRNPKTGKVISRAEDLREQQSGINVGITQINDCRRQSECPASDLASEMENDDRGRNAFHLNHLADVAWKAAAARATRRLRLPKLRGDHSFFSCLNLDSPCRLPQGSPFAVGSADVKRKVARECRPPYKQKLISETPSLAVDKIQPLPEVPGCPLEKVPASVAQLIATLALEPATAIRKSVPKKVSSLKRNEVIAAMKRSLVLQAMQRMGREGQLDSKESGFEELSTVAESSDVASEEHKATGFVGRDGSESSFPNLLVEHEHDHYNLNDELSLEHAGVDLLAGKDSATLSLLKFRFVVDDRPMPGELATVSAGDVEEEASQSGLAQSQSGSARRCDQSLQPCTDQPSVPAYRPGNAVARSPQKEMRREVQSLLNKVCPESVAMICDKIASIQVNSADDLEIIIASIFKKAVSEPHYCETYADLAFGLKPVFPEFPSSMGGKPVTFRSALLNICQNEFDNLPTCMELTAEDAEKYGHEDLDCRQKKCKERVLANMKFIGHLFLRQLLSAKVIGTIIQELTLCSNPDKVPEEHIIECAVELLVSIGHTLESLPATKAALLRVCSRLRDLKSMRAEDGKHIYRKRVQFAIENLLAVRQAGWTRRVFGEGKAKTKEEIRLDQERDLNAKGGHCGQEVLAGERPLYIANRL